VAVLITGGSGLIGTYVVKELLTRGEEIVVYDLKLPADETGIYFVNGTVTDKNRLLNICKKRAVDKVIHLAALLQFGCEQRPHDAIAINVLGTLNLLEVARRLSIKRFVFASSGAVYGPVEETMTEATPIFPGISLYGATKHLCEVLGTCYEKVYSLPFVALRYWGVYGPGEVSSPGMAEVFKRIESSISGKDVVITEVGPEEKRHFTFVKDAARAAALALEAPLKDSKIFNIAGGDDSYVTFQEFYQTIKKLCPSAGNVLFQGKGQNRGKVDISAARKEIGYQPRYTLEMGIQEDIDHWQTHKAS
jgi:nucleoside-diphosphate-sugar epimerase